MDAMKLSDFIVGNIEPILEAWEQFATDIPSAHNLDVAKLRDHAEGILREIALDLKRPQTADQQQEKSKGRGPPEAKESEAELHGAIRVSLGFSISESISEFRALRASVLRLWTDAAQDALTSGEEIIRFNEAIDQALSESLSGYARETERSARLFNAILSSSPDLTYIFDADGRFIYANEAMTRLYGVSREEIVGKDFFDLGNSYAAILHDHLRQVVQSKALFQGEIPCGLHDGPVALYEFVFVPVRDSTGQVEAIAGTARDVTERKAAEENAKRSANYDHLTGLANRGLFRDRLEREVENAKRTGLPIALLFLDLDGFKEINDQMGHEAGDELLKQAAHRISSTVRTTDTVARLGGDEFTVILTRLNRLPHLDIVVAGLLEQIAKPFEINGMDVRISASIGITLFPEDASTLDDLIRNADQAMYMAKKAGGNRFIFFTARMRDAAWARQKVIEALRQVLPKQQLDVYYQPIIDLASGQVVRAEALLRWHHPQNGLLLPGEFIGPAEEAGLIEEIGEWVVKQAAERVCEWSRLLGSPFKISVNKSPLEFTGKAVPKNGDSRPGGKGQMGKGISLELTEETLLNASPQVKAKLNELQDTGMQLAVDRFGTGCSAMSYFEEFALDYLKIDQSLVQNMGEGTRTVDAIIAMAHQLGLKVIGEGVETAEQRALLITADCDYAQGYLFSEPLPALEFEAMLMSGLAPHCESAGQR